jgi:hypothetical protein
VSHLRGALLLLGNVLLTGLAGLQAGFPEADFWPGLMRPEWLDANENGGALKRLGGPVLRRRDSFLGGGPAVTSACCRAACPRW